jgi:membrane protease YdiL (CAAX protease family)
MDQFIIPTQLLIIVLYLFRIPIIDRFPKSLKGFYSVIANDTRFDLGTWWKTVLVPLLVIVGTYLVWVMYNNMILHTFPFLPVADPLPLYIAESGILAPVSEEILQCFFLSAAFFLFTRIYKNRWMITGMCIAALVIVSYIFANAHTNPTPVNWLMRFSQFLIYGAIYYLNDRNLLPAIVAHSAWNLILLNPFEF